METDSTKRFSNRVDNYVRYRPGYPAAVINLLRDRCSLVETAVIADIGSGTGILSELFLKNGNPVYGVEPNDEMRAAAEESLGDYTKFTSVNGTAEATTLADQCAHFVTAGQAFHWFDPQKTKKEMRRILKPNGWVVLIWNTRHKDGSPMMRHYELLLDRYAIRYQEVVQTRSHDDIPGFFSREPEMMDFANKQEFDFAGLLGRSLSSSYVPLPGQPNYEPLVAGLRDLFERYEVNGRVPFLYTTRVYFGRLSVKKP